MSAHWRLAIKYAALVSVGALVAGAVLWAVYGLSYAGAFEYGAGVGLVSFVSMAATVSMLTSSSMGMLAVGISTFPVRYAFAAAALGVPAYLGLWPVLAMLGGFAGVYLAENMVLVPGVVSALSAKRGTESNAKRDSEDSEGVAAGGAERKVGD